MVLLVLLGYYLCMTNSQLVINNWKTFNISDNITNCAIGNYLPDSETHIIGDTTYYQYEIINDVLTKSFEQTIESHLINQSIPVPLNFIGQSYVQMNANFIYAIHQNVFISIEVQLKDPTIDVMDLMTNQFNITSPHGFDKSCIVKVSGYIMIIGGIYEGM